MRENVWWHSDAARIAPWRILEQGLTSMAGEDITYRVAVATDLPAITSVRTSVAENHLSVAEMEQRGITEAAVAASFSTTSRGWVAEQSGHIVAFTIADRESQSVFALFVRPDFAGRGIGRRLLNLGVAWLWDHGALRVWLTTRQGTKAAAFYAQHGWVATGIDPSGSVRFELERPLAT